MDVYEALTSYEKRLHKIARAKNTPIGCAIELLPLCNMRCKMCYVVLSRKEMEAQGRILTVSEWLNIVDDAMKEGLVFLLLTGGEPLIYPGFKELYAELSKRGLIISVNTNGTLLDESWAVFFKEHGVRRINITLYGKDDETYARLCNNPKGFTQVINAAEQLKKYGVPFRFTCSVTPDNKDQRDELFAIARKYSAPMQMATYMFPATRRIADISNYRILPEEAARITIDNQRRTRGNVNVAIASQVTLSMVEKAPRLKCDGFSCKAGHTTFWMNWKGEMQACGIFPEPCIDLKHHTLREAWDYIHKATYEAPKPEKCLDCKWQNICHVCPAACYSETGKIDGCPEYLCRFTEEQVKCMKEIVKTHWKDLRDDYEN